MRPYIIVADKNGNDMVLFKDAIHGAREIIPSEKTDGGKILKTRVYIGADHIDIQEAMDSFMEKLMGQEG